VKDFEPSPHFVARVMAAVRAENQDGEVPVPWSIAGLSVPLRCSVALGGALVTAGNLLWILASFLAPAVCG
jgi:hypothetical protein